MQVIGRIDLDILRAAGFEPLTDEVVLTEPQLQHIRKSHPGDYERYGKHIPQILFEPDDIFEAGKNREHSALLTKTVEEAGVPLKLLLRLKMPKEPDSYKNSVITFTRTDIGEIERMRKNKKRLYNRE